MISIRMGEKPRSAFDSAAEEMHILRSANPPAYAEKMKVLSGQETPDGDRHIDELALTQEFPDLPLEQAPELFRRCQQEDAAGGL